LNSLIFLTIIYVSVIHLFSEVKVIISLFNDINTNIYLFISSLIVFFFNKTFPVENQIFFRDHHNGM
jgi:hypothetical protein